MFRTLSSGDPWEGKLVRLVNNGQPNSFCRPVQQLSLSIVNTRVIPIWNTMGVIPGFIRNEVVVVGNHRDGSSLTSSFPLVVEVIIFVIQPGYELL